ncbi:MAG: acyl-CoA dehydrogenase family protein [Gemmatimonadota bacterium]|nr:acyl-CoA dehydrogenase family protein [Gemmatimonadota bacterium]
MPLLTSEQRDIQALARDFARGELRPHTARWDADRVLDEDVFAKLAEMGFMGMRVPEEHGGLGLDLRTYLVALEELAWGDAAVGLAVAIHNGPVAHLLRRHGTEEQRARWLPRLAEGGVGAFALSEPGAGSDPSGMETRAVREGDAWILTGGKRWVTNGRRASLVIVFARVDEPDGGTGAFLVEPGATGYNSGLSEATLGLRASETVPVSLDGVRADGILGEPGRGLTYALEALDVGRVGIAVQAVGVGRAAMEHALAYALEREQFGRPIAEFGAIQAKLAEMAARVAAGRALAFEAADLLEVSAGSRAGRGGVTAAAAVAKLVASAGATWVADEAIQIFGGYGYMKDFPVEKLLRDAKGAEIYEGTNEIMRHVIAREVLRESRAG